MLLILLTMSKDGECNSVLLDSYISRVAEGDTDALGLLYSSTRTAVYAYALSILKSAHDAEDVLHDCFIAVNSAAGTYVPQGKPMAWIITVTKNLCLRRLREKQRTVPVPEDDPLIRLTVSEDMPTDERMILEECMNSLSDGERQIVVLHAVSGLRHREIAEITGLPLSTVLSKYSRAIAKLRAKL